MNAHENVTENPVVVAQSLMFLAEAYPDARYQLERAAAMVASLNPAFRMELAGRLREARAAIIRGLLCV